MESSCFPGDRFIIRFTHSVDKTDVDEVIRVGKEDLIIDSTVYQSFGAGLPSTLHGEETMELEDGKMRIDHLNRPQKSIDLFIGGGGQSQTGSGRKGDPS